MELFCTVPHNLPTMTTDAIQNIVDALLRCLAKAQHTAWRALLKLERFRNQERYEEYDFVLHKGRPKQGVSLLVRARNEGSKIGHSIRSVLSLVNEVIYIDNASDDHTRAVVEALQRQEEDGHKIRIFSYPFRLARFGPEHDRTPEHSVHSATYYSNWGIAQCSFQYVCKWDGDMVLTKEVRTQFGHFLTQIQEGPKTCWTFPGQTVYRDLKGNYYLAVGEVNREIMVFPYGYNPRFYKLPHWECLQSRPPLPIDNFKPVTFYELKYCDEEEFAHWSTTEWPSERKRREWANFQAVRQGAANEPQFLRLQEGFLDEQLVRCQPAGTARGKERGS